MATKKKSQQGLIRFAIHPALVSSASAPEGFKAFMERQVERGAEFQIMAPLSQMDSEKVLIDLAEAGVFKSREEGGLGFSLRQTFFPRAEAVLAHHLRRASIHYYIGMDDHFVGYAGFPEGTMGLVLATVPGMAPTLVDWNTVEAFLTCDAVAGQKIRRVEPLRLSGTANVYRIHGSEKNYLLNSRLASENVADRIAEEKGLLVGMRDAGLTPVLTPVWASGNASLYEDAGEGFMNGASKADLGRLSQLLLNLDTHADKLRKLPKAPRSRLQLDHYVKALNDLWNSVLQAAQSSNKGIMLFMMTDLEQLRQDNINHFFLWCKREKWEKSTDLPEREQLFCPGQIGIHNCLRAGSSAVVLDASDCGWDDPAHVLADFFHNPEQQITTRNKLIVIDKFMKQRAWDTSFMNRFWAVADVVAVEWILKLLCVLLPAERKRLRTYMSEAEYLELVEERHQMAQLQRATHVPMEHLCKHDQLLEEGAEIR